jgi:hypothetical protein
MKKFVPVVFIAVMAGLVGVKVAVAGETPVETAAVQVELQR